MKKSFYRSHNESWFKGKPMVTTKEIRNNGGKIIEKGEIVFSSVKSGRGGFNVKSEKGVSISGVSYEKLELVLTAYEGTNKEG